MRKVPFVWAAVAACISIAVATQARASLILTLDDSSIPGIEVIVVDNSPIGTATVVGLSNYADTDPGVGVVAPFLVDTTVGNFTVMLISSGFSNGPADPYLDLFVSVESTAAGELIAMLTDTDFTLGGDPGPWTMLNGIGGATDSLVSAFQGAYDSTNAEFGMATLSTVASASGNPFNADMSTVVPSSDPFSLSLLVTIQSSAGGESTTFDAFGQVEVAAVPEPATSAMWLCFVALTGGLRHRLARRRSGSRRGSH